VQLSKEHLTFLTAFARSPEGKFLVQLLEAKLSEQDAKLRTAVGEEVYRAQGRAQATAELIGDIRDAHQRLTRSDPTRTSRSQVVA
jgi:ABC-type Fe3+/spermidine/putrescine transport system ATPase subunit